MSSSNTYLLIFISLILSLTYFTTPTISACTKDALNTLISSTNTYLAEFNDKTNTKTEAQMDTYVTSTLANTDYKACLTKIDALIENKHTYFVDLVTDECRETNTSSPQYTQNPCCNMKLMEKDCCRPESMTEAQNIVHSFKTDFAANGCAAQDVPTTRSHIRHHFRVQDKRKQICEKNKERRLRELEQMIQNLKRCPVEIMEQKECRNNAQCFSNVCSPKSESEPVTYTCQPASHALDKESALARCMVSYLPAGYIRDLQAELGIDTASQANYPALTQALVTKIGTNKCVDEDYYSNYKWVSRILNTTATETACTATQKCTDGQNTCADSSEFCGKFCGHSGVCTGTVTGATDSAKCADDTLAIGTCRAGAVFHSGSGKKFNDLMNRETCSGINYCTVECGTCTEQQCTEEKGYCFGFPFSGSTCVLPYTLDETRFNFKTCPTGTTDVGFGCKSSDNSGTCNSKGGKWVQSPSSQESCEKTAQNEDVELEEQLFLTCDEGSDRDSAKYKDTCTKCGFSNKLLFNWVMGSYNNGLWMRQTAWVKREMKSIFRWAPTIDSTKYSNLITTIEKIVRDQIVKSYGACALLPTLSNMREIACACEGSDNCFDKDAVEIASFRAYPGAAQTFDFKDATVTVKADSIPTSTATVLVDVRRTPLLMENGNIEFSQEVKRFDIRQDGEIVGIVAGQGVSLSYVGEGIDLCIKTDAQFNTTGYDGPKMGCKSTEGIFEVDSSVKIVLNGKADVICGTVTEANKIYYPVLVETSKYREDVFNSANRATACGTLATLLVSVLVAFIMMLQ
eukprot:CAMPEP_0117446528 /NCGR_PEP_ID=MMETSP0759-20121206/6389_1 /TAXON_ID=63605 /ORGANISM="Percolomonas cosmopolitus, Strain WS" /LENGTH=798 /DNA_ID=CAMNT_0005238801 /DNA_START=19 /DNA_END=2415 /DNA_ORIENTATION=+